MPVFSRMKDDALVITVDGDYTSNELRRVGFGAFESSDDRSMKVLLDLSGAAGIVSKTSDELRAAGAFFAAFSDRIARIAIVASPDIMPMFDSGSEFATEAGVEVRSCPSHADARAWLEGLGG